jgi:hypothetical protein
MKTLFVITGISRGLDNAFFKLFNKGYEIQANIRNFKDGANNEYFLNLYLNNELKDTLIIANKIIKEYVK